MTVTFAAQNAPGEYTLRMAATIRDMRGNMMDQNHDGQSGTSADEYVLRFVASGVDLAVADDSIAVEPVQAAAGQAVRVSWTVTNRGDQATAADGAVDRLRLSIARCVLGHRRPVAGLVHL